MNRRRVVGGLVGAAVVVVGIVVAWPRSSGTPAGTAVRLKNFEIDAPDAVRAGHTTFVAFGEGPSMHEFNIAETTLDPKALPLAPDGTIDDQAEHAGFTHVAEAEGIDIGGVKTLSVNLTPGHYVMYCNMEGHYMAGMVHAFEVTS